MDSDKSKTNDPMVFAAGVLALAIVVWFYGFVPRYGIEDSRSVLGWLMSTWNGETQLEFGAFAPLLILALIGYRSRDLRNASRSGRCSWLGLIAVFVGALFYVISHRLFLSRIAVCSLPILLWGACHFLWGWRVAKILFFPFFFLWLVVPWPYLHTEKAHLLLWVVSLAQHGCTLCGVETEVMGTMILPVNGDLKPIYFGMGCSNGVPHLMALLLIAAGWAYVAKIRMWQKALLFLSALPIAVFVNALKLVSIIVIAEKGDARWAVSTWYDWSNLVLVYPLSLVLFLVLHSIFLGGLPWKKKVEDQLHHKVSEKL